MIQNEKGGIHELIFDTINAAPIDTRKQLYSSILLTGGSTMFPGFPTRVYKELKGKFMREIAKGRNFEDCGVDIKIRDPFS